MGTKITEEKNLYAALNNCAFVSTKPEKRDVDQFIKSFTFLMDSAMIGVGVGFDTKGSQHNYSIYKPQQSTFKLFIIDDTREAWVDSLRVLLESYLHENRAEVRFDYSRIRKAGLPLKTFGGQSSGPGPLIKMHELMKEKFDKETEKGQKVITSRDIVDIMNIIGKCVVAGNIRRVAEIALGEPDDSEFIHLKDYQRNPDRLEYGWVSNNSIYAKIGMDYTEVQESILKNGGEPGLCWLQNM